MRNTAPSPRTSLVEQIHQESSAGRIHPRIAEKLITAHRFDPEADLEELICQVISGRAPTAPDEKEDSAHGKA